MERPSTFYGVELGARVPVTRFTSPLRGETHALINVGEVPQCASRVEAEHLGRLLIGRTVREMRDGVAGFEPAFDGEQDEDRVTSFSVYFYNDGETTERWDYDTEGKCVTP